MEEQSAAGPDLGGFVTAPVCYPAKHALGKAPEAGNESIAATTLECKPDRFSIRPC